MSHTGVVVPAEEDQAHIAPAPRGCCICDFRALLHRIIALSALFLLINVSEFVVDASLEIIGSLVEIILYALVARLLVKYREHRGVQKYRRALVVIGGFAVLSIVVDILFAAVAADLRFLRLLRLLGVICPIVLIFIAHRIKIDHEHDAGEQGRWYALFGGAPLLPTGGAVVVAEPPRVVT